MAVENLLVELFVEELPPKALERLGNAFANVLYASLDDQHLIASSATIAADLTKADPPPLEVFASPRRLGALIRGVRGVALDMQLPPQKIMPVSVGFDATGKATPALLKKLQALGEDASALSRLTREFDGKAEALYLKRTVKGVSLVEGLQKALHEAVSKLPIAKVMTYQLSDGWTDVKFVRPAHSLVALHGTDLVPVQVLGLTAGKTTQGHRFEAARPVVMFDAADTYAATLERDGAVIAGFAARRTEIVRQLAAAVTALGGGTQPIQDAALLDEVTALVERPNVLTCHFEQEFLEVPQECLILTMKANQKYFPLLDVQGKLTNRFLVVSNIRPEDPSAVIQGNERVVRPRLADAKFFFDQDRKKTLESRVAALDKVIYHNRLGTQGLRLERVSAIARAIAQQLGDAALVADVDRAAHLAKTDLVTDMVGEFPELQGIMGRYYALNDGLAPSVADAIEDHYKPRFAGDELPRGIVGLTVALADKLETLAGMFHIGNLPTGDKDPFALRRHALGVVRMLMEKDLPLEVGELIEVALQVLGSDAPQKAWAQRMPKTSGIAGYQIGSVEPATKVKLTDFIYERLAGLLRDQGYSAQEIDAVLALRPQRLGDVARRLAAVRTFAALPEAPALAAANKRIGNILKKAEGGAVDPHVSEVLLREPAEQALYQTMKGIAPRASAQFDAGDYTGSLQAWAALRAPVDAFFDSVMVNAEAADLRLNRLGLLATLHQAMNRVADLSRLAG